MCRKLSNHKKAIYTRKRRVRQRRKMGNSVFKAKSSAYISKYQMDRRTEDPVFRALVLTRMAVSRVIYGIQKAKAKKNPISKTVTRIGQVSRFARAIEQQFEPGMTWKNYGGRAGRKGKKTWRVELKKRPKRGFNSRAAIEAYYRCGNLKPCWGEYWGK